MLVSTLFTVLAAGLATAVPLDRRDVSLNAAATAEAQKFDATATRAFTATTITTSDGKCLTVDPFSGDFRENLTPVTAVACNGSKNQTWDVITSGVHNNVKGQALIVSSLTNACLNFDPRRAAGNQVLLFSCGGRADGGGIVANSQLFSFAGGAGPLPLLPQNGNNATCLTIKGNALDQTACSAASASGAELFSFGAAKTSATTAAAATTTAATTTAATTTAAATQTAAATTSAADCVPTTVTETLTVTVTASAETTNVAVAEPTSTASETSSKAAVTTAATTTAAATTAVATGASATIKVSGAGGVLNPAAVAESQAKDTSATRAATGVEIKSSTGDCLSVNATAGDFRENLIPIQMKACDGSDGQKFDFITKGIHNDQAGKTLIVSSLTNGCINFDDRRAAGDQVIMFACGGRADGSGQVQSAQLFPFTAANLTAPYALTPSTSPGVCLVNNNGRLSNVACNTASPTADQLFTIVA
ncbi:hypothetical protein C8R44DRAFT_717112 [Mycena epipterygia]|nr:hypothetical protein C8R44DRAFT_717112 [Mycena epipterygia]